MADQFIGLTILLTLNDQDQTRVRGLVAEVHGTELTLSNVVFVDSGYSIPSYTVIGQQIKDIEIMPPEPTPQSYAPPPPLHAPLPPQPLVVHNSPAPPTQMYQTGNQNQALAHHNQSYSYTTTIVTSSTPQVVAPSQFIDPAILSISQKPPAPTQTPPVAHHAPQQPQASFSTPPRISASIMQSIPRPPNSTIKRQDSSHGSNISLNTLGMSNTQNAHLFPTNAPAESSRSSALGMPPQPRAPPLAPTAISAPFAELSIKGDIAGEYNGFDETDDNLSSVAMPPTPDVRQKFQGKRSRRGKSHLKKQYEQQHQLSEPMAQGDSVRENTIAPGMFGGAIAQAASASASHFVQPGMVGRKNRRQKRSNNRYDGNTTNAEEEGWATEDVNDYKEREFDFQGNLDRFDKKSVFSQLKAEDTVAEGDRLVSFNRLPQRNPASKGSAVAKKNYHHTENVLGNYANGQSLAERDGWDSPEFIAEESESSEDSDHHARGRGDGGAADSGRSSRRAMSRQESRRRTRQLTNNPTGMRSFENLQYAHSSSGGGVGPSGVKQSKAALRLAPSHRPCPVVSPLQMLDVERIAEVELCLTDDMMTENAGRGIAQVAIQAFGKRISASNHNSLPVVLVFAGNHKSGARAIAAGRHLKNHHVRVMVCVLGLEREDELLENVRRQLNIFRNAGGRVARWEELASNLKTLDSPPELIIDGLLGTHLSIEDLRTDQQATAFELVQFANKSKASVLAVDIPSGVDGSTGEVAQLEDTGTFHMKAKWVVCMGAPKTGLLNALVSGVGSGWSLYVADIGISNTAWRKYGTRRRHGVEFAADWVVTLEYHGAS